MWLVILIFTERGEQPWGGRVCNEGGFCVARTEGNGLHRPHEFVVKVIGLASIVLLWFRHKDIQLAATHF
jgi:hypothetical protein